MRKDDSLIEGRCWWAGNDPLYIEYHDTEWGVPVHDDRQIFEMLILEGFQAGLSWITMLRKRAAFRVAFAQFDPEKVARFTEKQQAALMVHAGIIKNRAKIRAAVTNAQRFLDTQAEFGSFDSYIWQFTDYQVIRRSGVHSRAAVVAISAESDSMAKDLKRRGFKFVGSTICYAHMQATGMVNDHMDGCCCLKSC